MPTDDKNPLLTRERIAGGLLELHERAWNEIDKKLVKTGPKVARTIIREAPGVPGLVYDAANLYRAKDKKRAVVSLVGGTIGGALGAAGGPLGSAALSMGGEWAAEQLYDHHDELYEAGRRKLEETKQWMKNRERELARAAADHLMPMYQAPSGHPQAQPSLRRR